MQYLFFMNFIVCSTENWFISMITLRMNVTKKLKNYTFIDLKENEKT